MTKYLALPNSMGDPGCGTFNAKIRNTLDKPGQIGRPKRKAYCGFADDKLN